MLNRFALYQRFMAPMIIVPILLALFGCGPKKQNPTTVLQPSESVSRLEPGLFEDVAKKSGLNFAHSNGSTSQFRFVETFGGGCAFLDYDGDGFLDILLLSSGEFGKPGPVLHLYHNNKNGTFTDVSNGSGLDIAIGYGQGVTVGDYDNDGYPDIFVSAYGGCKLFHNRGKGAGQKLFDDVTIEAGVTDTEYGARWASGAAFGDYDNDGKLDLVIVHYAKWSPETDKKCPRQDGSPGYCVPSVYDGDGITLYHNEGNGRFKNVSVKSGLNNYSGRSLAVSWLDYNSDGRPDIYIANDLNPNYLLRNNGDGTFTEVGASAGAATGSDGQAMSGMGIALGDYNHTGLESILVPNLNGEGFSLFKNLGSGIFSFASLESGLLNLTVSHSGWGAAFVDIDRDGWQDVVTSNGNVHPKVSQDMPGITYEEAKGIYRNLGNGQFEDLTGKGGDSARPVAGRGLAIGDFDNDGKQDILAVNRNASVQLLRNVSKDNNHWISVKLIGTKSNRDGAGAQVTVVTDTFKQFAVCRLGSSYASCSDPRLFFGLGQAAVIKNISVRWPSGIRSTVVNVPADKIINITEPSK